MPSSFKATSGTRGPLAFRTPPAPHRPAPLAGLAVYERSACRLPSLSQTGGCPSVHASPGRSPNQGRRAGFREHRPALGEISPFGCEILRVRAQRPCLGGLWPEQGPCLGEGQKRVSCLPAALSSVRTLQTDASLPRRDDVQESQCFAGGKAPILPSKDDVQDGVDQRPGLGELRPSGGNISRACARRPGLGEIFEQSPGLGELWASDARRATRGSRVLPAGCPFRGPQCSKMQEVSFFTPVHEVQRMHECAFDQELNMPQSAHAVLAAWKRLKTCKFEHFLG